MDIIKSSFEVFLGIFSNVVFVLTMYYLVLSLFGIIRIKKKDNIKPQKTFALVVAAHNEETVIGDIIQSLSELNYPKEMYDVFVIADNCTDKTAEKVRKLGANVFERFDKEKRGKGYALEWMFDNIFKMEKKYDAVAVFDADNLVSKNFLTEMNRMFLKGYKVVQGFLDSKNPKDTWITGSYSISFWSSNRMFQLSRSNLGLSNQLGGTGFCIETEALRTLGWGATCLTEDLEFTCKLVLNGHKVGWAHEAVVYDEKPLTLAQSWAQRKRWMQGFADVSSRYFWKLVKKAIKDRSFIAFDCALYSIQPIVIILLGVAMIINIVPNILDFSSKAIDLFHTINSVNASLHSILLTVGALLFILIQFIYTPFLLLLDGKLSPKIFLYYLIYPIFSITWLPICIQGIANKNNKEWSHTVHTRSININDLEKAN
ncbi:glycosyl transferase family 2 [Clostridium manihotivorum]|uniref:Glycosyl transferase family 2 n=2 Tax=Clostridium manihotivorum TaxID=2320868 RepID=A0A410DXF4_9CLOT|nr:glycosyltransferase family 2 protein [Clostridium manihotivorum]QAA33735.1 glycosyl transferase family 2 [Clostridium manihotivorum]